MYNIALSQFKESWRKLVLIIFTFIISFCAFCILLLKNNDKAAKNAMKQQACATTVLL